MSEGFPGRGCRTEYVIFFFPSPLQDPTLSEKCKWLSLVDHLRVKAFIELTVSERAREGIQHLIRDGRFKGEGQLLASAWPCGSKL